MQDGYTHFFGMPVSDRAKILGIWLGVDCSDEFNYENNFKGILAKIQNVCDAWTTRGLPLKGKITVANSLLVSLLQYPCLIVYTPERVFREYKQMILSFIWNGGKPKISYESITQPIDKGCLKLINLYTRVQVNLLQWVKRIVAQPQMNIAASLRHFLLTDDLRGFFSYRAPKLPSDFQIHRFYSTMISVYNKFHNFEQMSEEAIRKEKLWFNPQVGGANAPIYWPQWDKKGISTVGDICHVAENRLLSHMEIKQKFGIRCSFLEARSMTLNIPMYWREALTVNWQPSSPTDPGICLYIQEEEQPLPLSTLSTKAMYCRMIMIRQKTNAALNKWVQGDGDIRVADSLEWSEICRRTFVFSRETKLQSFQYRILNRILPCGVFLKRIRIADSDVCLFCQEKDTIIHYLMQCNLVRPFWNAVCSWFGNVMGLYLDQLSPKEFLFWLPRGHHRGRIINFILIQIRFYIYRQKLFNAGKLSLMQWLAEFKCKLKIEKWICTRLGKAASFQCWNGILEELG